MATPTNDTGREERRRRIVQRGSDRLALITGRRGESSFLDDHPQTQQADDPTQGTFDDNEASGRDSNNSGGDQLEKATLLHETDKGEIQHLTSPDRGAGSVASSQTRNRPKLFSSRRLNSCILESEMTRGCCAFIIAALVVLSYVGYPLFGSHIVKSGSIIASRPLYILLLTDVTIVLARLLNSHRKPEETVEESKPKPLKEENQNWDGAVKLLERGLVAYQSIRAVFIDCSIYMVVVICGLSQV